MKTALILSGGGARAAYQVGVLKAIAELLPPTQHNPFQIICGTSSGSINAAKLATEADDFHLSVDSLEELWGNLESRYIHQVGFSEILSSVLKLFGSFFHSGIATGRPLSLFNNMPLRHLIGEHVDFQRLPKMIEQSHLYALCITALGYTSGQSISFFQGNEDIKGWKTVRRKGFQTELRHEHIMASSALPGIFPSVRIHREHFGDGAIRQTAPLSSALHLGADRMMVIGISGNKTQGEERKTETHSPSIAQMIGHLINAAFIDSLEEDIAMLERLNGLIARIPENQQGKSKLRPVDVLVIEPSIHFDEVAGRHVRDLPRSMRWLLSIIGATRRGGGSSLASYVLFEKEYCRELIQHGYKDAMAQSERIREFIAYCPI